MRTLLIAALALTLPVAAAAQDFTVKFHKVDRSIFKPAKIAVLSYSINFITGQRGAASSDVMVKAKVSTTLAGVDEATMRLMVNEAHADLRAQLAAANIALASDAEVQSLIADGGVPLVPGNLDRGKDGGIVIGAGVKKAFVSVGADAAPLTTLFQPGGKVGGFGMLGRIGSGGKLNKPLLAMDATMIAPSLILDFADTEAKTGRTLAGSKRASVSSEVQFAIRAMSPVNFQVPMRVGVSTPGMMMVAKDSTSDAEFALAAGVTSATSTAGTWTDPGTAKGGNAVHVDLPKWMALVRSAYRAYNAAIVAQIVAARTR